MKQTLCTLAFLCLGFFAFSQFNQHSIAPDPKLNLGDDGFKQKAQVCFGAAAGFYAIGGAIYITQVQHGNAQTQEQNRRSALIMAGAGSACVLLGGYFKIRQRIAPRGKETHMVADEKGVGVSFSF